MLLLQSGDVVSINQLYLYGPTVVILGMVLAFVLRALPSWRAIKSRELDIREIEAQAKSGQAEALRCLGASLGELGAALNRNSAILQNVAIEQRRATDAIRLMERIKMGSTDHLTTLVEDLETRLTELETGRDESENPRTNPH